MQLSRLAAVAALLLLGSCRLPPIDLAAASRLAQHGEPRDARDAYDRIAARPDAGPAARAQALTGAAQACDQLGDAEGARERLEQAISPELPGVTEPALFYLAEHLRKKDRARALNLYYRAAAGAQKNLKESFPYHAATERMLELSMSR